VIAHRVADNEDGITRKRKTWERRLSFAHALGDYVQP
jgi:hypothetical protein